MQPEDSSIQSCRALSRSVVRCTSLKGMVACGDVTRDSPFLWAHWVGSIYQPGSLFSASRRGRGGYSRLSGTSGPIPDAPFSSGKGFAAVRQNS
jgi:hypothetical protein